MAMMPLWAQAGFWGFISGFALVIGAAVAWFIAVPQRYRGDNGLWQRRADLRALL